jgi:8-oxo-dGTP pyrophosphatase MutT (NUDIX family)
MRYDADLPTSPWRKTRTTQVYDNPWIRVREDAVVRPDGLPGIYGVVEFKHVALGIVPLFANGDTLLVGQFRYTLDAYSWEIPAGGGDPARPAAAESARELREETGLVAARWTSLGAIHTSNSVTDESALLFLAEDLTEHPPVPEGTEQLRLWRLPFSEALVRALDGRLTDALTVAGLCRTQRHLLERARHGPCA